MEPENPYEHDEEITDETSTHPLDPSMKRPSLKRDYDLANEVTELKMLCQTLAKSNNNLVRENNILRRKVVAIEDSNRKIRRSLSNVETQNHQLSHFIQEIMQVVDKLERNGIIPK